MHEYSIAYDIYQTARKAALEHNASQILRVHIDMGTLVMANLEQVKFLFQILTEEDPLFIGAELSCHSVEPSVHCTCGYEGTELYVCPQCGGMPELIRGREIVVTNIEVEVGET
ncbi:MAG: hydrogenase maturation nickel metallochaperone HypA [Methanomicrobiales archaeon]|nr:hydrogenase maturation nickel metallochaperone HypA [Methanomicrobiales archaeon]